VFRFIVTVSVVMFRGVRFEILRKSSTGYHWSKGIRGNKSLCFAPSDSLVMIIDIDEEADDVILQQIAQIGTKRF